MGRRVLRNKVDLLTFVSRAIPNVPPAPPRAVRRFQMLERGRGWVLDEAEIISSYDYRVMIEIYINYKILDLLS